MPDFVPDVAVIVAVPDEMPVTNPVALTVAIAGLLLVHVNDGHVNAAPNWSKHEAVNWHVLPGATVVSGDAHPDNVIVVKTLT